MPYFGWVEAGLITQTDGDVTDYDVIERDIPKIGSLSPQQVKEAACKSNGVLATLQRAARSFRIHRFEIIQ